MPGSKNKKREIRLFVDVNKIFESEIVRYFSYNKTLLQNIPIGIWKEKKRRKGKEDTIINNIK